jgi:dihydropteroate synthase
MAVALRPKRAHKLTCGAYELSLDARTHVMGVLNRTPDSFSDGGKWSSEESALEHIRGMVRDGADIIDIGGESTRPGSERVTLAQELERTIPVIRRASREIGVPISIDTAKHEVADEAVKNGATIINDITGLKGDAKMADVVARSGAAVCIMHMQGTPLTMQAHPAYEDLIGEIIAALGHSVDIALGAGVAPEKILVDPGIGFGKTVAHNCEIIRRLGELRVLDKPILIGTSRKSFIGNVLARDTGGRLMGTAATCALAIAHGAQVIRVHDVGAMVDVARMSDAVIRRDHHNAKEEKSGVV